MLHASSKPLVPAIEDMTIRGELEDRIERAMDNLLQFRRTRALLYGNPLQYVWGADFQGRWVEAVSTWQPYFKWEHHGCKQVVEAMLAGQQPNGNFGLKDNYYRRFGNHRGLLGLLAHDRLSPDARARAAAVRVGMWFHRTLLDKRTHPKLALFCTSPGMAIEGLVNLFEMTHDERFLQISRSLARMVIWTTQRLESGSALHAHGLLVCLRGLLDLYRVTGQANYRTTVLRAWKHIARKEIWLNGAIPEFFNRANDQVDEACATGDWIRLNLALWRQSKDTRYLDTAECSVYNALYNNQLPGGGYSGSCNIEQGFRGEEGWYCCSMHAPMALHDFVRHAYAVHENTVYVNFFTDTIADLSCKNTGPLHIEQTTEYPRQERTILSLSSRTSRRFTLALRVPDWARHAPHTVTINGRPHRCPVISNGYLCMTRRWAKESIIQFQPQAFAVKIRLSGTGAHRSLGKVSFRGSKSAPAKLIGVFRGPLLLVAFRTDHENDMTWVYRGGYNEMQESGGMYGRWDQSWHDGIQIEKRWHHAKTCVRLTHATVQDNSAVLQWESKLCDGIRIAHRVVIYPTLPVCVEHEEMITLQNMDRHSPTSLWCCGTRLAVRKEQFHDKYKSLFSHEYPAGPPTAQVDRTDLPCGRQIKTSAINTRYAFGNELFKVRVLAQGARKIRLIKRRDWRGLYLCPAFSVDESSGTRKATIRTRSTYPISPFRRRKQRQDGKSRGSIQFMAAQ